MQLKQTPDSRSVINNAPGASFLDKLAALNPFTHSHSKIMSRYQYLECRTHLQSCARYPYNFWHWCLICLLFVLFTRGKFTVPYPKNIGTVPRYRSAVLEFCSSVKQSSYAIILKAVFQLICWKLLRTCQYSGNNQNTGDNEGNSCFFF